jgi:hypothetical protein
MAENTAILLAVGITDLGQPPGHITQNRNSTKIHSLDVQRRGCQGLLSFLAGSLVGGDNPEPCPLPGRHWPTWEAQRWQGGPGTQRVPLPWLTPYLPQRDLLWLGGTVYPLQHFLFQQYAEIWQYKTGGETAWPSMVPKFWRGRRLTVCGLSGW